MSIEKKSLISNRTASKKAIVTKPEVSKVAPTKVANLRAAGPNLRGSGPNFRGAGPNFRGAGPNFRGAGPNFRGAGPNFRIKT